MSSVLGICYRDFAPIKLGNLNLLWLVKGFEILDRGLELLVELLIDRHLLQHSFQHIFFSTPEIIDHLSLAILHLIHRNIVEVSLLHGEEHNHFHFNRERLVLVLLEELNHALTSVQFLSGARVNIGTELGKGLQVAELGQIQLGRTGHLFDCLDLSRRTDSAHRDSYRDSRTYALIEEVRFQINLAVRDRDNVGRDVSGHIARLGLDNRQRR